LGEEGGRATGRPFKWAGLPWLISRGQRSNATLPLPSAQRAVPVLPDPDPSSLLRAKRAHTCQGSCPLPGRSWACSINWWLPWLACLLALLRLLHTDPVRPGHSTFFALHSTSSLHDRTVPPYQNCFIISSISSLFVFGDA
jgi:hypothetical protein